MEKLNIQLKRTFLVLLVMAISPFMAKAQQQKTFSDAQGTVIEVEGTSTLHDWSMESRKANIKASFELDNGEIQDLNSLSFSLPVKSLKSGKSRLNKNAYEALKANQNPQIKFNMNNATVSPSGQNTYKVNGSGTLTIAGVSRQVNIETTCEQNGEGLSCTGSEKIDMTNFNVEPPSFMMGAMSTGEVVTIKYRVELR